MEQIEVPAKNCVRSEFENRKVVCCVPELGRKVELVSVEDFSLVKGVNGLSMQCYFGDARGENQEMYLRLVDPCTRDLQASDQPSGHPVVHLWSRTSDEVLDGFPTTRRPD